MAFGQFAATSQFYLFGRKHCTQTGYQKHLAAYKEPKILDEADLTGKVYMVTGSNQGIGKEIAQYVATRGATVYMVCRSKDKAEKAKEGMLEKAPDAKIHVLQGDCGLQKDIRRVWEEFSATGQQLDGLVCNAGAMLDDKTLTNEGVEVTLATHLLFGTYLLGKLALPALEKSGGRMVIVSSGGMYNTKWPGWDIANAYTIEYNGEQAYAYMKRGQVLLAERWAKENPKVKVMSAHPGWAGTEAVDKAYANPDSKSLLKKSYLEPLRTPWEGAEGMCWLLACKDEQLTSGAFYLDREPQVKHMAGPFFSEGNFTKNTEEEVEEMVAELEAMVAENAPSVEQLRLRHEAADSGRVAAKSGKLKGMQRKIDIKQFMGKWYVIGHIPTFIDKNTSNGVEEYSYDEAAQRIDVNFTYMDINRTKTSSVKQTAKVINEFGTEWKLSVPVAFVSLSLGYIIMHCEEDYSACVVGNPSRNVLYIMARTPELDEATYERMKNISESQGYKRSYIKEVPQVWDQAADSAKNVDTESASGI
eukprot:TRINITY_DN16595_c0_g1_i1.p1 TRINITY_DN16595_c0_g1~~TRINITY_DN16595_c0_g1_i1.p1  ORF type:complete len:566 (+),score=153.21 TRINITY_DN16595_c0_g1_i1:108-1700(+)